MLWILTPGGFEDFIEEVSVPAETPTVPPAHVLPPENAAEIVLQARQRAAVAAPAGGPPGEGRRRQGERATPSEFAPKAFGEPFW